MAALICYMGWKGVAVVRCCFDAIPMLHAVITCGTIPEDSDDSDDELDGREEEFWVRLAGISCRMTAFVCPFVVLQCHLIPMGV